MFRWANSECRNVPNQITEPNGLGSDGPEVVQPANRPPIGDLNNREVQEMGSLRRRDVVDRRPPVRWELRLASA
jgi:hypothetical protein